MEYLDLYSKSMLSKMNGPDLIAFAFLLSARLAPVIGLAPFFGAKILPHTAKVFFVLCLLTILAPKLVFTIHTPVHFNTYYILLFAKELFIGTLLGFFLMLPFLIVSSSGVLIDHQRGAASLMTNDPTIQNQSSPLGTFFNYFLIVLFWATDAPFFVLEALFSSYDLIAPDQFLDKISFLPESPLHMRINASLQTFVNLMMQLAMPGLLIILMTDTFLGIINRLAPQVQITFLGMGLKSWLALLIVCIGWSPFTEYLALQVVRWLHEFNTLIYELAIHT